MAYLVEERARKMSRRMVVDLRRGRQELVIETLARLVGPGASERDLLGPVLTELTRAAAAMIDAQAGSSGQVSYELLISTTSGQDVDVDQLDPPVRAVLRAMLAELYDRREDAHQQLAMVTAETSWDGDLDAVLHALLWTQQAMLGCENHGAEIPRWLTDAA